MSRQMDMLLDPFDPEVIAAAKANGVADSTIDAAQDSPTYQFVKEWNLALPLASRVQHAPDAVLRAAAAAGDGVGDGRGQRASRPSKLNDPSPNTGPTAGSTTPARRNSSGPSTTLVFRSSTWPTCSAGRDGERSADRLKKLMAVRLHRRQVTVGDVPEET